LILMLALITVGLAACSETSSVTSTGPKIPSAVASHGSSSAAPSGPGYEAAKRQWINSGTVGGSADQAIPFLQAIKDLTRGLHTDRNTSGYSAAISVLRKMTQIPDAMVTPAENAEAERYITTLDTFFRTPNLFSPSGT
jgi:hypothetical protein